jgi:hypothetical protein
MPLFSNHSGRQGQRSDPQTRRRDAERGLSQHRQAVSRGVLHLNTGSGKAKLTNYLKRVLAESGIYAPASALYSLFHWLSACASNAPTVVGGDDRKASETACFFSLLATKLSDGSSQTSAGSYLFVHLAWD